MTYHNATKFLIQSPDELPEEVAGTRVRTLWELLGNPQRNLKYVRLAGSSGKTVCAEMLVSCFKGSDIKVGCLTTPLRQEIRENIRIDGMPLSFEEMAGYVEQIYRASIEINKKLHAQAEAADHSETNDSSVTVYQLTKHEILLSAALLSFRDRHCDLCILESDHTHADPTRFLPAPFAAAICGTIPSEDKKEIGRIRSYIGHGIQEIVSAPQNQDAYRVISDTCAAINCRLTIPTKSALEIHRVSLSGSDFSYRQKTYKISLCGKFQITNATVVLEILDMLSRRGFGLPDDQISSGLHRAKIPSKFEILSVSPTIIADSTHSEVAVETVCQSMADFQAIIGKKIRLCLPNESLARCYEDVLRSMSYEIEQLILFDEDHPAEASESAQQTANKKRMRHIICSAFQNLTDDTILLISGPFPFTSEIRYEILKKLGF